MRFMIDSLLKSVNKISEIDKKIAQIDNKELDNKFIDNMRSMMDSLLQSVNKISEIDQKISLIDRIEAENKFIDNMRSMIDSLLQSVNKISEINKKIAQTYDKVTTYPYGTNAFKVCESEMLSKNKLNRSDEDNNNTICINNIKDKDKSKYINENILTKVYIEEKKKLIDNNNWAQKKTVKIFWNNNTISKICENWIFCCNNYAYIRSEELHTHLGELLYTREHKAGLSNKKSCIYIDTDELKMCSDGFDESVFKLKKEYIDMHDKIDDKMDKIYEVRDIIKKINYKLKENNSYLDSMYFKSMILGEPQLEYKINGKYMIHYILYGMRFKK